MEKHRLLFLYFDVQLIFIQLLTFLQIVSYSYTTNKSKTSAINKFYFSKYLSIDCK